MSKELAEWKAFYTERHLEKQEAAQLDIALFTAVEKRLDALEHDVKTEHDARLEALEWVQGKYGARLDNLDAANAPKMPKDRPCCEGCAKSPCGIHGYNEWIEAFGGNLSGHPKCYVEKTCEGCAHPFWRCGKTEGLCFNYDNGYDEGPKFPLMWVSRSEDPCPNFSPLEQS